LYLLLSINSNRKAITSSVSTSLAEPYAIERNCKNSFSDFLPAPSATLAGMETAARRSGEVKPNFSSLGKLSVCLIDINYKINRFLPNI